MQDSTLPDLRKVAADLLTVIEAGQLTDVKEAIAVANRGWPKNDLDAYPQLKWDIETFAELLSDFTEMPLAICRVVSLNAILPTTRGRTAVDVLTNWADKVRAAQSRERASTIIAAERRRVAS